MTLPEFLTSLLFFKFRKVLDWEAEHIWSRYDALCARIRRFIRNCLKSNERFMKWLNKPVKHGKPDSDWIAGQVKVFGDVWRL